MGFNNALAQLPESKFSFLMKNGKRSSTLNGFDFVSLIYCSYKFLRKTMPKLLNEGQFELLIVEIFKDRKQQIFSCDIDRMDFNEILYFMFWMMDEVQAIGKMEKEYLSNDPDIEMLAAGINDLNQFGELNVIDGLVKEWQGAYTHEEVENMQYCFIFDKQYKSIIEARIQRRLIKNKSKKK